MPAASDLTANNLDPGPGISLPPAVHPGHVHLEATPLGIVVSGPTAVSVYHEVVQCAECRV